MKNRKAFTVVELVIVIAIIAVLAAVLIPTFATLIKKANVSKDTQLIRNLNTALATDNAENGGKGHRNMTEALEAAEKFGYDVDKINASETDNEILWDSKNDLFCYFDGSEIKYIPESELTYTKDNSVEEKRIHDVDYWVIRNVDRNSTDAKKNVSETYSTYLSGIDSSKTDITITKGLDVGKTNVLTSITYDRHSESEGQEVVIRTNGGTLTIDAENDTVKHFGAAQVVTLTAVGTNSYHENGPVKQINIKKGRLIITNNKDTSIDTIYLQATGDTYDNIILATQKGAELPKLIARDNVSLPTGSETKLVVTIQTNVDENGKQPEKTEKINLYSTKGDTGNDVYEATNGYNVSDLALLVVEASSTDAKAQAAEQISNPEVVAKVQETKTPYEVHNETELKAALVETAKYILFANDISATSNVDIDRDVIVDGNGYKLTTTNYRNSDARSINVGWDNTNINVTIQNLTVVGPTGSYSRGLNIASSYVTLNVLNCNVSAGHYAINIIQATEKLKLNIYDSQINGWAALNIWGFDHEITCTNSVLTGTNDKDVSSWNNFATICFEADTTKLTDDYSAFNKVELNNCVVNAIETNDNYQAYVSFNSGTIGTTGSTLITNNCTFSEETRYGILKGGKGNTWIMDGEVIFTTNN